MKTTKKNERKKHVLLAVCGISPAVITETVYALSEDPPDSVIVITTKPGAAGIRKEIFDSGVWDELMQLDCFFGKQINFFGCSANLQLLPSGNNSCDADDIVSESDINNASNFILNVLRQYTENPDTRVTLSIAGGRKTMGVSAALCMSLLGREQDRLCHVLVNSPFDNPTLIPKFYYPKLGQVHKLMNGEKIHSSDAKLVLSYLPFVHCRHLFENHLQRLPGDYSDVVAMANRLFDMHENLPVLKFFPGELKCFIGADEIKLNLIEYLLYWMLGERKIKGEKILYGLGGLYEEFIDFVGDLDTKKLPLIFIRARDSLLKKNAEQLRRPVSEIGKKLKDKINDEIIDNYLPTRSKGSYGLLLSMEKIEISRTSAGRP